MWKSWLIPCYVLITIFVPGTAFVYAMSIGGIDFIKRRILALLIFYIGCAAFILPNASKLPYPNKIDWEKFIFAISIAFALSGPLFAFDFVQQGLRIRQQLERWAAHLCLTCGYDLTGNTSGICPECGTPISLQQ